MNHRTIANEWFQYANSDLESARFLKKMHPRPLEVICYHCQQSAEKFLKGYIAYNGGKIRKTHDLVALNKLCVDYLSTFDELLKDCINLTDYGVQTRYPFELDINEEDMQLAIKSAKNIKEFITGIIKEY